MSIKRREMREAVGPKWYALHVTPNSEYVVAQLLRKQGVATYIPTEIRSHKRSSYSKGKADFAVPLMPGFVFAGFKDEPVWYDLLKNTMIHGPLRGDGQPWRLDMLELLRFFSGVNDGCMFIDKDGLRLIHIPGRTPVRALTTRAKTVSARKRAKRPKKVQVQPPSASVDFLARFVHGGSV